MKTVTRMTRKHLACSMQNPANLAVTGKAEDLAVLTYCVTAQFPRAEVYGIAAQMRRAAVSIGSNIAEGCGRAGDAELAKFLHYSLGSASELEFQVRVAVRLKMGPAEGLAAVARATVELKRMIARLIASLRQPKPPPT
jgi:four helix bundle protein